MKTVSSGFSLEFLAHESNPFFTAEGTANHRLYVREEI